MQPLHWQQIQTVGATHTIIFLHDAWGCVAMWGDFPERVAQMLQVNCLLYDRMGHGRSPVVEIECRAATFFEEEADSLIQLMDYHGIATATLYGHSDGATISLVAAAKYPERIAGLLLESPHTITEEVGLQTVAEITERAKHTSLLTKLQKFHGNNIPNVFNYWSRMWSDAQFAHWNIIAFIEQIKTPIVAIRGKEDPFDTLVQLTTIADHAPAAVQLHVVAGAQHAPHKEQEEEMLALIQQAFGTLQSAPAT